MRDVKTLSGDAELYREGRTRGLSGAERRWRSARKVNVGLLFIYLRIYPASFAPHSELLAKSARGVGWSACPRSSALERGKSIRPSQ